MKVIFSVLTALFLLVGCQQGTSEEYGEVTIKDEDNHVIMSTSDLESASLQEQDGRTLVRVNVTDQVYSEEVTEEYLNEKVSIYLGDKEIASPTIRSVIKNGSIQIEGDYTKEEAETFVNVINQ